MHPLLLNERRLLERSKYDEHYFTSVYWQEDFEAKDFAHQKRFDFLAELILTFFPRNRRLLDVGSGIALLLRRLLAKGISCAGTEVSEWALRIPLEDLVERGAVTECSADAMPFADSAFDLVICTDVLEHIPEFDAERSINEIVRVGSRDFLLTINTAHEYEYHPTIRPRGWWESKFVLDGLKQDREVERAVEDYCRELYPEYEFFIFRKTASPALSCAGPFASAI